ncbi:MAG: hypothetical protein MJK04_22510, partial [Psychrosphaera sp.]|nr:hypothetical protein [Psychrosphaera sp.]
PGDFGTKEKFEGFKAYAPDGTIYTFDELRLISDTRDNFHPRDELPIFQAYMMVSKIEDRFGNWVIYEYDEQSRLKQIYGKDGEDDNLGREIKLDYNEATPFQDNISTVTVNGRLWQYHYEGSNANSRVLRSVTRPDTRQWHYDLDLVGSKKSTGKGCDAIGADTNTYTGTVTHPHGAVGTFNVKETLHGTSNVDYAQARDGDDGRIEVIPLCNGHMSLQSKTLSGPGLTTMNWQYSYSKNHGSYSKDTNTATAAQKLPSTAPVDALHHKRTTVTAPDGSVTKHYYNRDWTSPAQGMLTATEQYDTNGTTKLSTTGTTFAQAERIGMSRMDKTNIIPMNYRINKSHVVTTLHNTDGDTRYTTEYQTYTPLGVVTKVYQHNTAS